MPDSNRLSPKLKQAVRDALKAGMTPVEIMSDLRHAANNSANSPAYRQAAQETADDVEHFLRGLGHAVEHE